MDEQKFLNQQRGNWMRLESLITKGKVTPKNLTGDEILELLRLYRSTTTDLATLQAEGANPSLIAQVNTIIREGHEIVYRHRQPPLGEAIRNTLNTFAQVTRKRWKYIMVAIAMFFVGVGLSAIVLGTRPDLRGYVIQDEGNTRAWKEGLSDPRTVEQDTMMWGFYASNNTRVALISGAVSATTFGVGTAYLMYYNGVNVGGLAYEMQTVNKLGFLLASLFPHGASELTGMFISGAAGLVMAMALINPGRRGRWQALKTAAPDAMILLVQSMVMMLIAAPFEGFFSFNPHVPSWAKVVVGSLVLAGWLIFWTRMGRDEPEPEMA